MAEKSPDVRKDLPPQNKEEALKTLKGSNLQKWVEDQERNVSVRQWNAEEQLASEEKRAEFTAHAREVFAEFTGGIQKDKAEYGGDVRWQAFHQECAQHIHAYERATPNQDTPTSLEGMKLMLDSVSTLEKTMKQYQLEKDVKIKKVAPKAAPAGRADDLDAMEKYDWRIESGKVFDRFEKIRTAIKQKNMLEDGTCGDFIEKSYKFFDVYGECVVTNAKDPSLPPTVTDEALARTTLWEFNRLLDAYEPAVQKRLEGGVSEPKAKTAEKKEGVPAKPAGFSFTDLASSFESLKSGIADNMFAATKGAATPAVDIRAIVLGNAGGEPFPTLELDQLRAVLWSKAHITDLGGKPMPGEDTTHFNRADIPSVAKNVAMDVIRDSRGLYAEVSKAIEAKYPGTDKKSVEKRNEALMGARLMIDQYNGITYATLRDPRVDKSRMLATPADHAMVADGLRQLGSAPGKIEDGRRFIDALTIRDIPETQYIRGRWLRNKIVGKRNDGIGQYNAGVQKKFEFDQGKRELLEGVRAEIEGQLQAGLDKANVEPAETIDSTPRPNVTRSMLNDFDTQMNVLDAIGKKDLVRKVWMPSEKKLTTVVRKGASPKPFNFVLDAFANPEGGKGTPPGMLLEVSELSEDDKKFIEQIKKEDEEAQNKLAQSAE